MADEDSKQYKDLLSWAASRGITDIAPEVERSGNIPDSALGFSLRIATFPDAGGRGLAAARDLKLGELILRVPQRALMNGRTARQDAELAKALASYPSLSPVQVLCVHLLREVAKGRTSEWYPYLLHLPRIHHTASFYRSFEAQALQVKDAVLMAEGAAQSAREDWIGARPMLEKLGLGRRFSALQAWLWAAATVSSRTLYVPWDEAGTLCPIGDFLNYACPGVSYRSPIATRDVLKREEDWSSEEAEESSCGLEIRDRLRDGGFEFERGEYCFYARQNYEEGQQVLLCYGTYTNLELLEHYGFLLPFNPNDKVHMCLPSIEKPNSRASYACEEPVLPKNLYIDYEGRPSFSFLAHLRLRSAPASLKKSPRHLALAGQQISPESDRGVYQWLKIECQTILTSCPTSLLTDELLLAVTSAHHSTEELRNFMVVHKETAIPTISFPKLVDTSEDVLGDVLCELEGFLESVSTRNASSKPGAQPSEEGIRFKRWRLAVEWRLSYKTILERCISHCSRILVAM